METLFETRSVYIYIYIYVFSESMHSSAKTPKEILEIQNRVEYSAMEQKRVFMNVNTEENMHIVIMDLQYLPVQKVSQITVSY